MRELDRLRELIARHAGEGLTPTALPGVSVLRATATTEPLGDVAEPTLAVIAQGIKETELGGRSLRYGPGQFLLVPVELPVVGHIVQASPAEPLLAFVLSLRPEKIAALLAETTPAAAVRTQAAGIGVSDASPALLDAIAGSWPCSTPPATPPCSPAASSARCSGGWSPGRREASCGRSA